MAPCMMLTKEKYEEIHGAFSLSQFGITWGFSSVPAAYGQFGNGDYWVVGPVTITSISPASIDNGTGRIINGSMLNPTPANGQAQGYDSETYGYQATGTSWDASLNVARPNEQDMSPDNPLTIAAGNSLVSTISESDAGVRPQINTAAILTVLESAPAENSFRPCYTGSDKSILFNETDIDYSMLESVASLASSIALDSDFEDQFEKPWIDHVPLSVGRYIHPSENMPDYGQYISMLLSDAILILNQDYTDLEKRTLLIRILQIGIDMYGLVGEGMTWTNDGGHMLGRKLPILFAGYVLGDTSGMGAIGAYRKNDTDLIFQEDQQTWEVVAGDIGRTLADEDAGRYVRLEYVFDDIGMPEWGIRHYTYQNRDSRNWLSYYRDINTRPGYGTALCVLMLANNVSGLDSRDLWGWSPYMDYIDRAAEIQEVDIPDEDWTQGRIATRRLWEAYRANYEPVAFDNWTWGTYLTPSDTAVQGGDLPFAETATFDDDFTGGLSNWTVATWAEHGGQTGAERCYIENNQLKMIFINDSAEGWLSSAIQSNELFGFGRWEANLKPSSVSGVLNSFYTIDWGDSGEGSQEEVDIEFLTYTFDTDTGTVHFAAHEGSHTSFDPTDVTLGFNPSDDFHTWGVEITPAYIRWYVDDVTLQTYYYSDGEVSIDHEYMLKLNCWTAESWINGPPAEDTECIYLIDWIRFYPYGE